ncbi:MAG TPA: DUF5666 domain-containing protein [Candidatus Dormibacteraeota bacterium]|nr:DUF5666 domain-containing protein [Candidatus Dormibacteraeota bacterium]
MRKSFLLLAVTFFTVACITGCGGSYTAPPPSGAQAAQMSVSITDTPPAGVTVLSFEVTVTGASLSPGGVDLLAGKTPPRLEVKNLETESAFLSTLSIPAGTYTGLALTFANPELTFLNNTGAALAGCAVGAVCEIMPTGTLSSTVSGNFVVTAGMQSGILIDLNLASLLSSTLGVDFSASGAVSATQQTKQAEGELEDLEDVNGILKSPANNQFTLQTTDMGNITVSVDASTEFSDFESCTAANFSCLVDGQSVEVDLALMGTGTFLAKKVELHDNVAEAADDELDGVVSKVDSGTQFELVVLDELRNITNVSVGNPVIVTLQSSGATFEVDANGLTVPSSLQQAFTASGDTSQLIPGQVVEVRVRSTSGGPAPAAIMVTTDRVRLRMTQFTATVSGSVAGNNFNVGTLPGIFTSAGVTSIQVQTSSNTNFENVSGASGLADGNTVSLRGLLFASAPNPVLIADKVRKR